MLEKLWQAAIITFLLHLIAGLSPAATMHTKTASSANIISPPSSKDLVSFSPPKLLHSQQQD